MFAIPVFGLKAAGERAPVWLRIIALSGLGMTILYVALSVVPIIQVENRLTFALKIGGLIVLMNLAGAAVYLIAKKRQKT
jgi:hypothetical protein